jgi:hypothetical protein
MTRPKSRMPALFDISLGTSEPVDQEIPKTLLGRSKFLSRIHASQDGVLRHLAIKTRHQATKTIFADDRVNAGFIHGYEVPVALIRALSADRTVVVTDRSRGWAGESPGRRLGSLMRRNGAGKIQRQHAVGV